MKHIFSTIMFTALASLMILSGCAKKESAPLYSDGAFTGQGAGRNGPIVVVVNIADGTIADATIIEEQETSEIGYPAERKLLEDFKTYGTTELDAISGATITSTGLLSALQAALDASRGKQLATQPYEDSEADIVIIGAGGAGLTAATEAALRGAKTLVLEMSGIVGGNTNSSTGGLNASETSVQKRLKINDSNEQFFKDTMKCGHYKNDESLVRLLVEKSAAMVDWLQGDEIGADLSDVGLMGGSTNKRTHRPVGGQAIGMHLVPKLYDAAKRAGAEIRLNSEVTDILEENGRAVAVSVKNEAGSYIVRAKAIIIATGGFGANPALIEKYRPDLKGFPTTNVKTTTGSAFAWLEKFNAELRLMNEIQIHPSVVPGRGLLITEAVRGNGAIMLSHAGKRFVNELDTRDVTSNAVLALPEKRAYIFFNQEVRNSLKAIESYEKAGVLVSAETVSEMARKLGMEESTLQSTLDEYNTAQVTGKADKFGRTNMAVPLSKGPFYAVEIEPAIHHTMGGVAINTKAQVLSEAGIPVPGLYAAGEVTGGVHGDNRLGGNSVADITIFGKIAADSACDELGL